MVCFIFLLLINSVSCKEHQQQRECKTCMFCISTSFIQYDVVMTIYKSQASSSIIIFSLCVAPSIAPPRYSIYPHQLLQTLEQTSHIQRFHNTTPKHIQFNKTKFKLDGTPTKENRKRD